MAVIGLTQGRSAENLCDGQGGMCQSKINMSSQIFLVPRLDVTQLFAQSR